MARKKDDGKGRLGGRAKGTPNKATATLREWVVKIIDKNRKQVERDLKALDPKDRLLMIEKMMQYVIPKQQAVKADVDLNTLTDVQLDVLVSEITKDVELNDNTEIDKEDEN